MQNKLERLLRYHRQHVWSNDTAESDRHERALKRLKKTKTFLAMCDARRAADDHRRSMRLLQTYA
jgi:hypothetical protein